MECRTLDLTIVSADDLRPVTLFHGMEVYVVVSVHDDLTYNNRKHKTPVDKTRGNNPRWNFPIKLALNETALLGNRLTLKFQLFTRRTLLPDALVGEVHVPGLELVSLAGKAGVNNVSYQVRKRSGNPKGILNISYKVGDKLITPVTTGTTGVGTSMYPMNPSHAHAHVGHAHPASAGLGYEYPAQPGRLGHARPAQMVHEYPAQPAGSGYAYPPQHGGSGYSYPVQQHYPAQHAASGYAYPPQQVVQPRRRNNNLGMGLGAGLLGGALGGLAVGELTSDMGHNNDGYNDGGYDDNGYDGGYDDGGFDDGGFDY